MAPSFLIVIFVFASFSVTGLAAQDATPAPAVETIETPNEAVKGFTSCKGVEFTYSGAFVTEGGQKVLDCTPELTVAGSIGNKACLGLCVAEKYGNINEDRSYNLAKAREPLDKEVKEGGGGLTKEIVDIQMKVIERCAKDKKFIQDGVCKVAKEFDDCIKIGQKKDCEGV